jgi:hypothetical protein
MKNIMCLGVWVSALIGVPAAGSTVVALPEGELTQEADAVIFGKVLFLRTLVGSNGHRATEATLQVYDGVKGAKPGDLLRIQSPGGQANGLRTVVSGATIFEKGQLWLAFLNHHRDNLYTSWGLSYGMLPVKEDTKGKFWVSSDHAGLTLSMTPSSALEPRALDLRGEALPLVLRRLRDHLRETTKTLPGVPLPRSTKGALQ